jgi:hypothetical protein
MTSDFPRLANYTAPLGPLSPQQRPALSAFRMPPIPRMTPAIGTRATPHTTFKTVPTGGVSRPMELLMMNITPK